MELRQLKYFAKVAELNNFSGAARALNITQSTLSQQIKQLEGELGVELFLRDSHHVNLTDVGEAFLPSALRTISEANSCIDRIRDVQSLGTGEVKIGCTYTFAPLLTEVVLLFMKQYPGVKLDIVCQPMEELMQMLERQQIDVALSYKPAWGSMNIESHILFDNRLAVVVSKTHPLAECKYIRLSELEKHPMALPATGLQARNTFDRLCEGTDYRFQVQLEINDVNVLLSLVKGSKLVTVLSQATVARQQGLIAIPLDHKDCQMEGAFSVCRDAYMKRSTKEFLRILSENRSLGMAMMEIY